jgi:hypothetical protein
MGVLWQLIMEQQLVMTMMIILEQLMEYKLVMMMTNTSRRFQELVLNKQLTMGLKQQCLMGRYLVSLYRLKQLCLIQLKRIMLMEELWQLIMVLKLVMTMMLILEQLMGL